MSKREDKRMLAFISKYGINTNKKIEPIQYANPKTFQLEIGTKIIEINSGVIGQIVEVNESKGIGIKIINRGDNSFVAYEWQSQFENRLKEGFVEILQL